MKVDTWIVIAEVLACVLSTVMLWLFINAVLAQGL